MTALASITEEVEQKKRQTQPELYQLIRAMFSSPRNRDASVYDGLNYFNPAADNGSPCPKGRCNRF